MYRVSLVFVCVIAAGLASPAPQLSCPDIDESRCAVSNVDITPCKNKDRCALKIGQNASISFDFTPEFSASELSTLVTTTVLGVEKSLEGFDTEACKFTACPTSVGKKQTLTYNLPLKKHRVVKGKYELKWTVWNKADTTQVCCFFTRIKLLD